MKLRLRGNSIRLRLTKGEVAALIETGRVVEALDFGGGARLSYQLSAEEAAECVSADFADGELKVLAPRGAAADWAAGAEVGLYGEQAAGDGGALKIAIEKDFACLTARLGEDESDNYPHPEDRKHC
jgi:hypothetical protein